MTIKLEFQEHARQPVMVYRFLSRTSYTHIAGPFDRPGRFFIFLYFQLDTLFSVYVQYLLSSFLYMFQVSQAHHQEV